MAAPSNDPNHSSLQDEASRLADTARDRASSAFEEVKLASNQLVDRVREYIEDANVKHVAIKKDGRTLLEIPMTVGVGAGAAALLFNPVLSAVGALAALVSDVTVVVERDEAPGGTSGDAAASDPAAGPAGEHVANVNDPDTSPSLQDDDKTVGRP
jgi:hypothetical protein